MNCSEDEKVCSVKKENNLGYYRLHTIWRDDGFLINIASKDGAWRGEMTPNDVKIMSSQLELDPKVYLGQCKTALTSHEGQPGITYAVDNGSFIWKKIVDEDSGIKIKLGSVMLKPTNFIDTIQNLVTVALECNKKLQKELEKIDEEKNRVEINRNELSQKLDKLILLKDVMENDLYSKFILLLNSKKKKIVELSYQSGCQAQVKNDSEYKNPYNLDTDNDDIDNNDRLKKNLVKRKSQRLKKMNKDRRSFLLEESLRQKKEPNVEIDSLKDTSRSDFSSTINVNTEDQIIFGSNDQKKSEMPSSKDELLHFFFSS